MTNSLCVLHDLFQLCFNVEKLPDAIYRERRRSSKNWRVSMSQQGIPREIVSGALLQRLLQCTLENSENSINLAVHFNLIVLLLA